MPDKNKDPDATQYDELKRQEQQSQEQKERKDGGQGAKPGQTDQDRNRDTGHHGNR